MAVRFDDGIVDAGAPGGQVVGVVFEVILGSQRGDFLIRKISFAILTLAVVVVFNFFLFRILPGDRVTVELSPYDLSRGRITYRAK